MHDSCRLSQQHIRVTNAVGALVTFPFTEKTNTALNIAHTRGTKHILSRSRIDAVCFDKDANDYGYT